MRVKVRMLGILSDSAGVSEVDLDFPEGSDIGFLLNELIASYQGLRADIWDPVIDSPEPNALILYNGVEVNNLQGLNTRITEGSEVVLLAVTHGG
jgi:molybdopterin converting factor small subunit